MTDTVHTRILTLEIFLRVNWYVSYENMAKSSPRRSINNKSPQETRSHSDDDSGIEPKVIDDEMMDLTWLDDRF